MTKPTYLHVRGVLLDDVTYVPRPGYESGRRTVREGGDSQFALVLCGRDGMDLYSVAPEVSWRCRGLDDRLRSRIRGVLPCLAGAVAYELRRAGRVLYRCEIPDEAPATPRTDVQQRNGSLVLTLAGKRADRALSHSVIVRSEAGRRFVVARSSGGELPPLDVSRLPVSGTVTVLVAAHDGIRSSEVEAAQLEVPRRPAQVFILSPEPDQTVAFGQPISVLGCHLDATGEPLQDAAMVWSLDGEPFAHGCSIAAADPPETGGHRLTLACGEGADRVECSISFVVAEPDRGHLSWVRLVGLPELSDASSMKGSSSD